MPSGIGDNEQRHAMGELVRFSGEKAQILKWVVRELDRDFPGIDARPDVCGGEPCIVRTRIPVFLLRQARRLGASEQALLAAYPHLRAEDLVNAWAYARSHAIEIESQIRENETAYKWPVSKHRIDAAVAAEPEMANNAVRVNRPRLIQAGLETRRRFHRSQIPARSFSRASH
jgi:uncharacterized protein (DUF433 family)